jgi:hypothetical protein
MNADEFNQSIKGSWNVSCDLFLDNGRQLPISGSTGNGLHDHVRVSNKKVSRNVETCGLQDFLRFLI